MLIQKDGTGQGQSRFKCDRCNRGLSIETRHAIYLQELKMVPKKQWDLCDRCFSALKRGIEKGK